MKVQCKKCPPTSTVDLKLTVSTPSTTPVSALPKGDFLIITWTEAETGALALVFGKGQYKFETAKNNNFTPLLIPGMRIPEDAKYQAYFFKAKVNGKSVICLKSEIHPKLQTSLMALFLQSVLGSAGKWNFSHLVTTGTAGGIWATLDIGDVVVTNSARYGLTAIIEKQQLPPYVGIGDVIGSKPTGGYSNWYDYANNQILQADVCVNTGLLVPGGRQATSPKPTIYYKAKTGSLTDVVSNSRISDDECGKIATYRTLGATLDENDAYVAETCHAAGFQNWAAIRNISDLPCAPQSDDQYDNYGFCSSINGAYAVWAFVMGH